MSLLLAAFLVVHGGIHIGYICGRSWPFEAADPWLVTALGASSGSARDAGVVLALVAFFAFLLAAPTAIGLLPSRLWSPLIGTGSVASALLLILFATPWTLPGLAIDAVLLWAVLGRKWRPAPFVGRRVRAGRPVTS